MLLPKVGVEFEIFGTVFAAETRWLTRAWLGALLVLFCNTAAYSAEIFYGALKSIPVGEIEAADSFGMSSRKKFTRIIWPYNAGKFLATTHAKTVRRLNLANRNGFQRPIKNFG